MKKKRFISIRSKLLMLIGGLVSIGLFSYMSYAIYLFNSDKEAYIFENEALLTEGIASEVETSLLSLSKLMDILAFQAWSQKDISSLIDEDMIETRIVHLYSGKEKKVLFENFKSEFLEMQSLDSGFRIRLSDERPFAFERISKAGLYIFNSVLVPEAPLVTVIKLVEIDSDNSLVVASRLLLDRLVRRIIKKTAYTTFLLDSYGEVLLHPDMGKAVRRENLSKKKLVHLALSRQSTSGAGIDIDNQGIESLQSYAQVKSGGLVLVSMIGKDKAFIASKKMIDRTIIFTAFLVCMLISISILFSERLTRAIKSLFEATLKVASGDFGVKVQISSNDEIGSLSESFNTMTDEIQRLMKETEEKAALEKELETASLVQEVLFPVEDYKCSEFELASYYTPANQCGGDWWYYHRQGNYLYILIGDATGHGVSAALITAAAQSCFKTHMRLSENQNDFFLSPSQLMGALNFAVFNSGKGRVKMTFFVARIDLRTGGCVYSNASHDLPYVCRSPEGKDDGQPRSRKSIEAMTGKPDICLGQQEVTTFKEHNINLNPGDVIFWYTDGLTEGANLDSEEWGERRLLRKLVKICHKESDKIKDEIVDSAFEFFAGSQRTDDITVVVGKFLGQELKGRGVA